MKARNMNGKVVNETEEIIIRIGFVIWDPGEEMLREKKRGQKVSATTQKWNSNYHTIFDAALTRWKNLQSNLHNDDKEYTIGLENLQAVFTPGSAKECFPLDKYKGELVKVFKRITISLYC